MKDPDHWGWLALAVAVLLAGVAVIILCAFELVDMITV